ncbi:helix-turn-helix domain-containing protein [Paenibacillus chitinolyticus]|uniref:helix-turn-helix domain-containing protein n=1 Tax=Paenibacillus chitinolyticus TaxID=79263 RepID=UPI00366E5758
MERGERNITLINLAKIAQALNVEVMELLNFSTNGSKDEDIIVAVTLPFGTEAQKINGVFCKS